MTIRWARVFPICRKPTARQYRDIAKAVAAELCIPIGEGVYAAMLGPSYETPAEIRYLRAIGADVVGMSTVLEVIAANHMGMKVLGISCVTNMAAGILRPENQSRRSAGDRSHGARHAGALPEGLLPRLADA